jgi:hypothetical protein
VTDCYFTVVLNEQYTIDYYALFGFDWQQLNVVKATGFDSHLLAAGFDNCITHGIVLIGCRTGSWFMSR